MFHDIKKFSNSCVHEDKQNFEFETDLWYFQSRVYYEILEQFQQPFSFWYHV